MQKKLSMLPDCSGRRKICVLRREHGRWREDSVRGSTSGDRQRVESTPFKKKKTHSERWQSTKQNNQRVQLAVADSGVYSMNYAAGAWRKSCYVVEPCWAAAYECCVTHRLIKLYNLEYPYSILHTSLRVKPHQSQNSEDTSSRPKKTRRRWPRELIMYDDVSLQHRQDTCYPRSLYC
jgi:hypothetical protein